MKKLKLRPFVLPSIYMVLVMSILLGALYSYNKLTMHEEDGVTESTDYVTDTNIDEEDETPVVSTDKVIIKPVKDENVKIAKYFYEKADKDEKRRDLHAKFWNRLY